MRADGSGYKIIWGGQAHTARTLGEAAGLLLRAREQGATNVRARRRESLTRDRDLTGREQAALVSAAANLLRRQVAA